MSRRMTVVAGLALATILTLGTGSVLAFAFGGDDGSRGGTKLRAEAVIEGAPGSGIMGKVTFVQAGGQVICRRPRSECGRRSRASHRACTASTCTRTAPVHLTTRPPADTTTRVRS
jgi:hypothetical protein